MKLDVMQKVPELVVHKRMSQGEKGKDTKEKEKVPGWSIEEMKERPNIAVEEDTEEMKRWRSLNQSEMELCWKKLAERMEVEGGPGQIQSRRKQERDLQRLRQSSGMAKSAFWENTSCSVCNASRRSQH